jgi:hypothetical protein
MQPKECINFDLKKLEARSQGDFIQVPEEVTTMQSFLDWLDNMNSTGFNRSSGPH